MGSRYFVMASNAREILFLLEKALDFLQYAGKSVGNKLEQDELIFMRSLSYLLNCSLTVSTILTEVKRLCPR